MSKKKKIIASQTRSAPNAPESEPVIGIEQKTDGSVEVEIADDAELNLSSEDVEE